MSDTAAVVPLSCQVCLADGLGQGIRTLTADREMVRPISLRIASNAQEFIIGWSGVLIASFVEATE